MDVGKMPLTKGECTKALLLIHEQIKGNRYDRSIGTDTLKHVFERNKMSNLTEILQQCSTKGILADREGKIYLTSHGVKYVNTLLADHKSR